MSYGNRRYGNARYGRVASRTFFETFTETVVLNGSLLNQVNLQEDIVFSDSSVKTVSATAAEDVYLDAVGSRTGVLNRVFVEDLFLQADGFTSSSLSRVYTEGVVFDALASKNIISTVDENIYLADNSLKTVSTSRQQDFLLNDSSSKILERRVLESFDLDSSSSVALVLNFLEQVYMDESDLSRGDNIIKIYLREFDEDVYFSDENYLLSIIRGVGIPEIITEQIERYDLGLDVKEIGIDVDVTGDTEDSGSL